MTSRRENSSFCNSAQITETVVQAISTTESASQMGQLGGHLVTGTWIAPPAPLTSKKPLPHLQIQAALPPFLKVAACA